MSSVHLGVNFLLASLVASDVPGVSYGQVTWATTLDYPSSIVGIGDMVPCCGWLSDDELVIECLPLVLSLISAFSGEPAYNVSSPRNSVIRNRIVGPMSHVSQSHTTGVICMVSESLDWLTPRGPQRPLLEIIAGQEGERRQHQSIPIQRCEGRCFRGIIAQSFTSP